MTQQALPKAANFGDLALNQGTNMEINAQLINIGSIERTKTKQTPFQKCVLADQGGNQEKCTLQLTMEELRRTARGQGSLPA